MPRAATAAALAAEARRDPKEPGPACVLVFGDLPANATLELRRGFVVHVDAGQVQLHVRRQAELEPAIVATEAALVEVERAALAIVGQEVGVVLVRRRQVEA